ncbi:hypothetical protein T492DRAFT_896177 [Pavlovales sp. CCMP2436]|nr:hypothetical protein T492DRAFT_896177 [Pavlovales sp. CCMP2436]
MSWQPREAKGKLPSARYWHSAALVGRKLMVWGGHNGKVSLGDALALAWPWFSP